MPKQDNQTPARVIIAGSADDLTNAQEMRAKARALPIEECRRIANLSNEECPSDAGKRRAKDYPPSRSLRAACRNRLVDDLGEPADVAWGRAPHHQLVAEVKRLRALIDAALAIPYADPTREYQCSPEEEVWERGHDEALDKARKALGFAEVSA